MSIICASKLMQMRRLPKSDEAELEQRPVKRRVLTELIGLLLVGLLPMYLLASFLVGFQIMALLFATGVYLFGSVLIITLLRQGFPHRGLGLGNQITLGRFIAVSGLSSALFASVNPWLIIVISLLALVADGFDGFFARKNGRVSDFGARLDMEVDSALAAVLAINLWVSGIVGPAVLLLAIPRYLFVSAAVLLPWMNKPLPYSLARRVISVVQIASLIGLHAPFLPDLLITPVAWAVAAFLLWSFGRDIAWLWRKRL